MTVVLSKVHCSTLLANIDDDCQLKIEASDPCQRSASLQVANVVIASLPHVVDTTFVAALLGAFSHHDHAAICMPRVCPVPSGWVPSAWFARPASLLRGYGDNTDQPPARDLTRGLVRCIAAAQHSQQERARAQVKAEEATAAWRSVFAADESQQQQATSSDQAGASSSCEPSLLDLGVDLDDPLQVTACEGNEGSGGG